MTRKYYTNFPTMFIRFLYTAKLFRNASSMLDICHWPTCVGNIYPRTITTTYVRTTSSYSGGGGTRSRYWSISDDNQFQNEQQQRQHSNRKFLSTISCVSLLAFTLNYVYQQNKKTILAKELSDTTKESNSDALTQGNNIEVGIEIDGLPTYDLKEVARHIDLDNPELGVWVVYKAGVYDVTNFVKIHPGGNVILLGAGNSIEPFWQVYGQHNTQQVYQLLESFRIGNLRKEDRYKDAPLDTYEYLPERSSELVIHHQKPFNAETPPEKLVKNFYTPNNNFFIRNHLSVPEVDPNEYLLEVEGLTLDQTHTFTLEQLKTLFPKHTVTSVIQCAGNRRDAFNQIKEVKGIAWRLGAIGNAKWSGAKLVDVVNYCGAQLTSSTIKHVQFEGLDLDATSAPYGASVPADKALDPYNEFILAYEMNDEPIPADHGFPVRLIAPGIVGARNVKWLGKIVLSEEESTSHWQRKDYKSFPPSQESATDKEFASAYSIQELPVQSAICIPSNEEKVQIRWKQMGEHIKPVIEVCGYAWSGGGRSIIRVDVSIDGGKTWKVADLELEQPLKPTSHTYSWTLWKADICLETRQLFQGNQFEIVCRAFDASYNTQPKECNEIWNFRGLLNNSWHHVKVQV